MRMGCPAPLDGTGGPRAPLDSGDAGNDAAGWERAAPLTQGADGAQASPGLQRPGVPD